jgi:putative endopeptidase
MKKTIFFALATGMLLGITSCNNPTQMKNETIVPAIDLANMDLNVKPGDDFFRYVNGTWMKNNEIPPEYSQYGAFTILYENNQVQLRTLVEEVSAQKDAKNGSVSQKIRDLYNSGMDSARINEVGVKAIENEIAEIEAINSIEGVQAFIANMHSIGEYPLFYVYSGADQTNSSMEIANFYQGGLSLPDVSYYLSDDERSAEMRTQYIDHLTKMFILKGDDEIKAKQQAETILKVETEIAKNSKTRLELRDPIANFNKMELSGLQEISPKFDWKMYFTQIGVPNPGEINIGQVPFIEGISQLMENISVDEWKTYLMWNLLDNSANYLSDDFVNQNFEFFGKTLSGRQELQPRWKRVLAVTSGRLGEAIGQLYVEKHFPPEAKDRMVVLVENLRLAFGERIKNLDWMTDETKVKALNKLDAITVKVGYPDEWRDYSALTIVPDNYIQNARNSRAFEFAYNISKIGKPVDKKEWGMTPQTVNAYYNPSNNEIVFPAGILQPPFFNKDADDAVNYGAIGVVIGHEMTHGFDDQGRQYDQDGNLNDWWTEEDAIRFKEKTNKLVEIFNNYIELDSLHVDGELTLGENIADLGGLSISYDAMQKAFNGKTPEPIDGFTADQRFYLGYGQVWRQNIRDKELMRRLKEDVHSPGDSRVNVPTFNLDTFIAAFDIQPTDKLWIPVENRAKIW